MFYAPHILQVKKQQEPSFDEFGRIIPSEAESWVTVSACRCDDNTTREFTSVNGSTFRSSFHVVCEGRHDIKAGDVVRCIEGERIISQGTVLKDPQTNWFNYMEVWL